MKIIRFSVNHPVTTCMLMLALLMGGAFSFSRMEVELLPSISIPTLLVTTEYPKTSPEKVHEEITLPLEGILNGMNQLDSLNSISLEGESRLVLSFDWGCDIRAAEIEVREKISGLEFSNEAGKTLVRRLDPSSAPVFRLDVFGDDKNSEELRRFAEQTIRPRFERLGGVGEVEILGGTEPEYRVIGVPDRLSQYNLTVLSLVNAISRESQNRKGGEVKIEGGYEAALQIYGKANSISEIENLIVVNRPAGGVIKVKDVAKVVRTGKAVDSYARIDGKPSVGITVRKTSDASVVTVVGNVRREWVRLSKELEIQGISGVVSQDDSQYVLNAQTLVYGSILQGVLFAGILLFLFLRDIRATIIVGLTTPISIMAGAIFLNAFGISRNVQTLGGLGLAAGMTLDSSIVLIESIYRQLGFGLKPKEAAIRGASEVATSVFSSSMTTVVVFLPILFIPGLMQEMFKSLAHAVIWSILMSMVVGLIFIPMVAARILSPPGDEGSVPKLWLWFRTTLEGFEKVGERRLAAVLDPLLKGTRRKIIIVGSLIAVSLLSLVFLPGKGFLPQGSVDELWIRFESPAGTNLDYVDGKIREVESMLKTDPYRSFVKSVSTDVRQGEGRLFIRLFPGRKTALRNELGEKIAGYETMRPTRWRALSDCLDKIRNGCESIPDFSGNCLVTLVDKVRGGTQAPIIVQIYSKNLSEEAAESVALERLRTEVEETMIPAIADVPGITYQRVRKYHSPEEFAVSTEETRQVLSEKGYSTQDLSNTIRASVYGVAAGSVIEGRRETDITVRLENAADQLGQLKVRSQVTGELSSLDELAIFSSAPVAGSAILERADRKTSVNLEGHYQSYDVSRKSVSQVATGLIDRLKAIPGFEEGYGFLVKSEAKDTRDSFRDALLALIISLSLIYMIMCSQFENFVNPLAIMVTIPLATAGSVLLLNVMGEIFGLAAFTGAIVLCGVVVNNGIILVEYISIMRKRGVRRHEAIIGGSVRKLKSILITTLTSISGMVPLVLGIGEGTELYKGVAAVVVGGLLVSTPLTLIALPLLYSLLDEAVEAFGTMGFQFALIKERIFQKS